MTFVITQPCIDTTDQSCVEVCPVDCIHFEEGADRMLYINSAECIDCGACQPACPVTAIFPDAEVPSDMAPFTAINELWYSDPAAARAQVQQIAGGEAAPQAAPAASAEAAAPTEAPAEQAAPSGNGAAPAAAAPAAAAAAVTIQAPAEPLPSSEAPTTPPHLSPISLLAIVAFAVGALLVFAFPGPADLKINGIDIAIREGKQFNITWHGQIGVGVLVGLPLMLIGLGVFVAREVRALSMFAARGSRRVAEWRWGGASWRRSEEMRRFTLEEAVRRIAEARYPFPSDAHPDLRTYVNLPSPAMALEFGGGGGEKLYPDVLVARYPGNHPTMVVQVETKETLTREQALYVWSRLETAEAPLDLYVPAGLGGQARDFARSVGLKHVRIRTWRWQPTGMIIREL